MLAASPDLVISQVYGGGGNAGAPYTHDFIELFNRGSAPVSLNGMSLQYTSATGTGNFGANPGLITELPNVAVLPGQYFLVQEASQAAVGVPLPTPDVADSTPIAMAAGAGKVVLVSGTTSLECNGGSTPCSAAALGRIIDRVGYGNANFFEGAAAAPTLTNTTAAFRGDFGCTDTDDNAADFSAAAPAPRNAASAPHPCSGAPAISVSDVTVTEGHSGTVTANFTVSLSAPAGPGGVVFDIATQDGSATTADRDYAANTLTGQTIPEGGSNYTFDVTVFGDVTVEANEAFFVNLTNVTGAIAGDVQGAGTITNDDFVEPQFEVVISQVYGGGGNAGATLKNDFIELFNRGTAPVSLNGWSVQYTSAAGTTWQVTALTGSIGPGQYYLVQQAAGAGGTMDLPLPDATGGIPMSSTAGKVVLRSTAIALAGACPSSTTFVDLVGYGAANCFEGAGPTFATENPTGALRKRGGCFDSNDNRADFSIAAPTPRNSASPARSCDYTPAAIHDIQGAGLQTPFLNTDVTTTGIVTARKSNGFFVQAPDADADMNPATSEGIFVFTSTAPAVAAGDFVTLKGTATEFFSLTQLESTLPGDVVVSASGQVLPAVVPLTTSVLDPAGGVDQLERFENMRMYAPALVSVAPTNGFGETVTVLPGVDRPMREPGIEAGLAVPPDPTSGVVDCCIPRFDRNPERIMIDSDGLAGAVPINVTSHVTFSNVTGPLDFTFGDYKLLPETPPSITDNISAVPVAAALAGEFTIAGFNIENFGGNATQRRKAALAIREVMQSPDIIGHIEILNLASLQTLADEVNGLALAAGEADPGYQAVLIPAPNPDNTQNVGFLVKTSRIRIDAVTQERASETFVNPISGRTETLHDRPPLVLRATVDPSGADPRQIIVVVNHLRSFIDIELVGGEGVRVRAKRTAQAESLAGLLQELQTANPATAVISIGDYNAYQFNDGYTDPIAVIKGVPTADDQIVVDESPDLVNPDFVNLTDGLPAASRYTFIFEGTPQALDHVLVNSVAQAYVQRYAVARANSDFPESPSAGFAGNPSRPERSSDHDMPVAYFKFPPRATTASVAPVTVTYDVDGQDVTLTATVAAQGKTISEGTVTFKVETPGGTLVGTTSGPVLDGTASAVFTLSGTIQPQALIVKADFSGGPTTVPSAGTGTLTIQYGVCLLYDPDRAVKKGGAYPIKIQLCDASGTNVSSADVTVTATGIVRESALDTTLIVESAGTANADGHFRFDADLGGYILNLSTKGLSSGVYRLSFTAGSDPTQHEVEFRVR